MAPIVTLAEARDWIGVYGDTSLDDEICAALEAAVEKVADNVGYRVADSNVVDYFAVSADRGRVFELSEPGIDTTTVQVRYYDCARAIQLLPAADWYLDPSSSIHTVRFESGVVVAVGAVQNPWQISYQSRLANIKGVSSVGRLKLGVRTALNWYWGLRGPGARNSDTSLLDRALTSLLQSCRRNPLGTC